MVIPLFKSHYSIGRSILTLEKAGNSSETEPDSIIDLATKAKLSHIFLVEDGVTSFLEAITNIHAAKLQLVFGLRISICQDVTQKSNDALATTSKYIIFVKNTEGYKRLIKLFTFAASEESMYYVPRIDFKNLQRFWSDEDLMLAIPFYDSFIFRNLLYFSTCVPDFSFTKPVFFVENNDLWFDSIVEDSVNKFCSERQFDKLRAKSIYYAKDKDFLAYLTFRCINNRSALEKPELEHLSSPTFSFESWARENNTKIE